MSDILFVSESEVLPELELAKNEISHYNYNLSFPVNFNKAVDFLKGTTASIVLINANSRKIEAYELAKEIKEIFRGGIKTFVYLPNSSPNEGSKFGLVNAEVEDEKSITNIVDKLPAKDKRDYILDENVISIYSMSGGAGTSFISILMAYVLDYYSQETVLLESTNTNAIKRYLNLAPKLSLLMRDKSKELDQAKDLDWFSGFISKTPFIKKLSYLNLFNKAEDKQIYLDQASAVLQKLADDINDLIETTKNRPKLKDEMDAYMFGLSNSLKLVSKELEGESFSLFDEVIQLGSKLSKNIVFDIGNDVYNPINKQLLKLSNNLVVVFRDVNNLRETYQDQKAFFKKRYNLNIIPVIAPPHYYYSKYEALKHEDWMEILGDVPLIYPYDPETVMRFTLDHEHIDPKDKLFKFGEKLLDACSIQVKKEEESKKSLLNFLTS